MMSITRLRPGRRIVVVGTAAAIAGAGMLLATAATAQTGRLVWAPATKATVHPGVSVTLAQTSCLSGFALTDGTHVFLSVPASCAGVNAGQAGNGCRDAQMPIGIPVTITGARYPGHLVYSSWASMQTAGVTDPNTCLHNDLALVQLDQRDIARTNPSVPAVGGPRGVATSAPAQGDRLTVYLGSSTQALALGEEAGGWAHWILAAAPMPAADAGAPVLSATGQAIGMVSVVPPTAGGRSQVSDLGKELGFLHRMPGFTRVRLVSGTQPFVSP